MIGPETASLDMVWVSEKEGLSNNDGGIWDLIIDWDGVPEAESDGGVIISV